MVRNGVAYIQHLICILESNNEPLPEGIVVSQDMFDGIKRHFEALCHYPASASLPGGVIEFYGIKVYRGMR